jgi:hypothetical protein
MKKTNVKAELAKTANYEGAKDGVAGYISGAYFGSSAEV